MRKTTYTRENTDNNGSSIANFFGSLFCAGGRAKKKSRDPLTQQQIAQQRLINQRNGGKGLPPVEEFPLAVVNEGLEVDEPRVIEKVDPGTLNRVLRHRPGSTTPSTD